jgi:hypothetical protein
MKMNLGLGLAVALMAGGCAERPFVRADPPVSHDGVTVALVGQTCGRQSWNEAYDTLDLDVAVRVTNASAASVDVVPAEIRLLARGNSPAPRSSKPKMVDAPIVLPPNSVATVHVHFLRSGNAKCDQDMQLALDRAVEAAGRPVMLRPLSFKSEGADT